MTHEWSRSHPGRAAASAPLLLDPPQRVGRKLLSTQLTKIRADPTDRRGEHHNLLTHKPCPSEYLLSCVRAGPVSSGRARRPLDDRALLAAGPACAARRRLATPGRAASCLVAAAAGRTHRTDGAAVNGPGCGLCRATCRCLVALLSSWRLFRPHAGDEVAGIGPPPASRARRSARTGPAGRRTKLQLLYVLRFSTLPWYHASHVSNQAWSHRALAAPGNPLSSSCASLANPAAFATAVRRSAASHCNQHQ